LLGENAVVQWEMAPNDRLVITDLSVNFEDYIAERSANLRPCDVPGPWTFVSFQRQRTGVLSVCVIARGMLLVCAVSGPSEWVSAVELGLG
jgi:hypothetical protein